jgi:hypothetical protein
VLSLFQGRLFLFQQQNLEVQFDFFLQWHLEVPELVAIQY